MFENLYSISGTVGIAVILLSGCLVHTILHAEQDLWPAEVLLVFGWISYLVGKALFLRVFYVVRWWMEYTRLPAASLFYAAWKIPWLKTSKGRKLSSEVAWLLWGSILVFLVSPGIILGTAGYFVDTPIALGFGLALLVLYARHIFVWVRDWHKCALICKRIREESSTITQ